MEREPVLEPLTVGVAGWRRRKGENFGAERKGSKALGERRTADQEPRGGGNPEDGGED